MALLTGFDSNPKTKKQLEELRIEGVILHFLAAAEAHRALGLPGTFCPWAARNGCEATCLVKQGRGVMRNVYAGRLRRSAMFLQDRPRFDAELRADLRKLEKRAARKGYKAVARLDGTSDLGLALQLAPEFPAIQFYDYTKSAARCERLARAHARGELQNYHLTFSRGAGNEAEALDLLARGVCNVTVVFRLRKSEPLPATWKGFPVLNGDENDFRFLDPRAGHVIGLHAKGTAYYDTTGFVAEVE